MSYSKLLLLSAILASVEARFGQEQTPVAAVSALQAGAPGEAATLAGGIPSTLLGAADPCAKLELADKIAALGDGADVLDAAKGLVAAEQNFNPFATSVPNICGDASLPATEALRGIVPLIDPAVTGSDTENANSAASLTSPFDASGLSVAEVMQAQGFSNFTLGRAGRKADEGTFLPTDPVVAQGQQDALNPNIIINRVCDQLTNVCGANDAAKTQCKDAQAQIEASGDRSAAVADTFNGLLGF
ncbi:hypothetical protein ColLi_07153 [Colletotrichum liriopes]|uniref:Cell wall protein n=1 Tax=Colletotrichum liriopes TaxID=708192 RepID=A0AA37GNI9_9PEZI|nr:hypothetical protein ColLi_07153 [Colletotrichum liriopes]